MSISDFFKTITVYCIVIVSLLCIFQTSSTIMNVLGSGIEGPNRTSTGASDMSFMADLKSGDPINYFETGMEERNKDN